MDTDTDVDMELEVLEGFEEAINFCETSMDEAAGGSGDQVAEPAVQAAGASDNQPAERSGNQAAGPDGHQAAGGSGDHAAQAADDSVPGPSGLQPAGDHGFRRGSRRFPEGSGDHPTGSDYESDDSDEDVPDELVLLGHVAYPCDGDLMCKVDGHVMPYFFSPVYLENKVKIGIIDQIIGGWKGLFVNIRVFPKFDALDFESGLKLYIPPELLIPLEALVAKRKKKSKKRNSKGGVRGKSGKYF